MAFSVQDFMGVLNKYNETSRTDKFDVYIPIPTALAGGVSMEDLALLAEASELPGRDIGMIEYRHYGFIRRVPYNNNYGQASFTFICTGALAEKQLFDRWLDSMVPAQNGLVEYPVGDDGTNQYECDITVNQYDMLGNMSYQVQLQEAMPVSVAPIAQSWGDDSIQRLNVSFVFRKWISAQTNQSSSVIGNVANFNGSTLIQPTSPIQLPQIKLPNFNFPSQSGGLNLPSGIQSPFNIPSL